MTSVPQFCQKYIASLVSRPAFSLARLLIRPSCRGRVVWRPHMPHPMLATSMSSHAHVHPYRHVLPANVAKLPAPINCTYSRSKWAVRSFEQGLLFEHFFQKFSDRVGTLGIYIACCMHSLRSSELRQRTCTRTYLGGQYSYSILAILTDFFITTL